MHQGSRQFRLAGESMLPIRACLLQLICFSVWTEAFCSPRFVQISAEIELFSYVKLDTNGLPIENRRSYTLQGIVGTNQWRIDSDFISNAQVGHYFDGTNVYQSVRPIKEASRTNAHPIHARAKVPFEIAKSNLTITISPSIGGHPHGNAGVNIPWLAFCSGPFLKRPGRSLALPTTIISITPDAFGYADKTSVFDDELGLPIRVELFTSKSLYEVSINREHLLRFNSSERAKLAPRPPIEDGQLAFSYEVHESTNFLGWTFPEKFSYTTFARRGNKWEKYVSGLGRLTSIKESPEPTNVFINDMPTTIVDRRFRHPTKRVDSIIYRATGNEVLSTNDPALQAVFQARVKRAWLDLIHRLRRGRWVAGISFFALGVLPLSLYLFHRYRTSKKPQDHNQELYETKTS